MKNADHYTNPLAQAACVASNLAALAREALESAAGEFVKICEAKKGAIGSARRRYANVRHVTTCRQS